MVLMAVLPFSRALLSTAVVLMFVAALFELAFNRPRIRFNQTDFVLLAALVLFCMLDGLRASNTESWVKQIEIRLPLLLLPFSYLVFQPRIKPAYLYALSLTFCTSVSLSCLGSMINYALHYDEINQLVLQSKHVPIMGGMHHITFSVFSAFAVFVAAYLAYTHKKSWLWILAAINFAGLHVLTARTGLFGFYFALFLSGVVLLIRYRPSRKVVLSGLAAAITIPVLAYFTIGSFHNRVINTANDLKVIVNQTDANYKSMGMRIEAARTALDIFIAHPLTGVGVSDIAQSMAKQYDLNRSSLFMENRILPHAQFIMEAAVHGIPGLLVLLAFFILPVFHNPLKHPILFVWLWALLFFGCWFECLFDRQHGILLVTIFWMLYRYGEPSPAKDSETAI